MLGLKDGWCESSPFQCVWKRNPPCGIGYTGHPDSFAKLIPQSFNGNLVPRSPLRST